MSDFELLSIVFVVLFGVLQVHIQTLSLHKDRSEHKYKETKNSYPSREEK